MAVNYAKFGRVGNLGAAFQQVLFVQNFWKFHNIDMVHQEFKFSKEQHKICSNKNFPKIQFTIEIA